MNIMNSRVEFLIVSSLQNNLDESEQAELLSWINASELNKCTFEAYKSSWQLSEKAKTACSIDVACDWQKMKQRLSIQKPRFISQWLNVAAVVTSAVLISSLAYIFTAKSGQELVSFVAKEGVKSILLPDSSRVILNRGAEIEYASNFNSNSRIVNLKGEAFFQVLHNDKSDFRVTTNTGSVKVLGTRFSVNAPINEDYLEVKVELGKVLMTSEDKSVILTKGMKATVKDGLVVENDGFSQQELDWKASKIVFKSASLIEVLEQLKVSFSCFDNYRILAADTTTKVTTTFENQTFEEVLDELSTHFDKKIILQNRTLIISN